MADKMKQTSRSRSPQPARSRSPKPSSSAGKDKAGSRSPKASAGKKQLPGNRSRSKTPPQGKTKSSSNDTSSGVMGMIGALSLDDILGGSGHHDNDKYEHAVRRCIPSEFLLIASQDDVTQAQEDYFAMDHYKFPTTPRIRRANGGSVATCALLQLMHENPDRWVATGDGLKDKPFTCLEVSQEIKKRVKACSKIEAKPTISSSRSLGPPRLKDPKFAPVYIVPPEFTKGTRRALLIGVVAGEGEDLRGPPNDVQNMEAFLKKYCGFKPQNITILRDDKEYYGSSSTKKNIWTEFKKMVKESKPGDVNFIQFSGHGGRMGNNLYILPSDYKKHGQIMDEDLLKDLIKAMPAKVYTTMLVDCCYSGTVGDLPYVLAHNHHGKQSIEKYFDIDPLPEVLEKEKNGGVEYQQWKQARAEKRLIGRVSDMAIAAATVVYHGVEQGATFAAKTATDGATLAAKTATDGANLAAKTASDGAHFATKTASDGAHAVAKTASDGANFAGKAATDTARGAMTMMSDAAHRASDAVNFPKPKLPASPKRQNGGAKKSPPKSTNSAGSALSGTFSVLSNAANSVAHSASEAAEKATATVLKKSSNK